MRLHFLLSAAVLMAADAMRLGGVSTRPMRVATRSTGVSMGLQFDEAKAMAGDPNAKNYRKLSDALKEADVERRKEEEEAMALLKAEEEKRNRRAKKMEVMNAIPDSAEAGKVRSLRTSGCCALPAMPCLGPCWLDASACVEVGVRRDIMPRLAVFVGLHRAGRAGHAGHAGRRGCGARASDGAAARQWSAAAAFALRARARVQCCTRQARARARY